MATSQKNLAYPDEFLNNIDDYKKPVDNLQNEDFFSELKNKNPDDEGIGRTKELIKVFINKSGEELTKLYLKSDVLLLADVFERFVKVSTKENRINPLHCFFLPSYTYQ